MLVAIIIVLCIMWTALSVLSTRYYLNETGDVIGWYTLSFPVRWILFLLSPIVVIYFEIDLIINFKSLKKFKKF